MASFKYINESDQTGEAYSRRGRMYEMKARVRWCIIRERKPLKMRADMLLGSNNTILNVSFEIQLVINVHAQVLNSLSFYDFMKWEMHACTDCTRILILAIFILYAFSNDTHAWYIIIIIHSWCRMYVAVMHASYSFFAYQFLHMLSVCYYIKRTKIPKTSILAKYLQPCKHSNYPKILNRFRSWQNYFSMSNHEQTRTA